MKLSDLFRQLSYGELSNLSISNSGSGTIVTAKQPQLIHYVNDALIALHTRFPLAEKNLIIEMVEGRTKYELSSRYSEVLGDPDEDTLFIKDLPELPFKDDAVRILTVSDTFGKLPLNDEGSVESLYTPSPLVLQVPEPVAGMPLGITYQAYHPRLVDVVDATVTNLLDQEIILVHYLDNALQQYVAHKVFSHMNGQENILKGQEYLAAYEADCLSIEQRDLVNQTWTTTHSKLDVRGFV